MQFSPEIRSMVKGYFALYPEEASWSALDALEEGREFVLRYFRGSVVPIAWPLMNEWLVRMQNNGRDLRDQHDKLFDLSERETIRAAIMRRLELELEHEKRLHWDTIPIHQ